MTQRLRRVWPAIAATALLAFVLGSWAKCDGPPRIDTEARFLKLNDVAMTAMMAQMEIKPTRDVDRDFVMMMIPHHHGAIEMSKALLLYGRNEKLRRLAQEIIVTQQEEIAAMRLAVGEAATATGPQRHVHSE